MRKTERMYPAACGLLVMALLILPGCGGNLVVKRFGPEHIVPVSQFQKLEARKLSEYAVYLDKGESFPLAVAINDENLEIRQKTVDVVAKQRLYFMLKVPEDLTREEEKALENFTADSFMAMNDAQKKQFLRRFMLYLSKDAMSWAAFTDPAALKKVLGIKSGSFGVGFGMGQKEGMKATFNITTVPAAQN